MTIEAFNPRITDAGRRAAINASGTGFDLNITHVSLGTGVYDSDNVGSAMTGLVAPIEKATIASGVSSGDGYIRITVVFPAVGNQYVATEVGFWAGDPDNGGTLFAVWSKLGDYVAARSNSDYVAVFGLSINAVDGAVVRVLVDPDSALAFRLLASHEDASNANAHPQYVTKVGLLDGDNTYVHTTGEGASFQLSASPAPSEILEGFSLRVKFARANTGACTLSVNGLPSHPLKVYDGYGNKRECVAGDIPAGMITDIVFDGTDFVVLDRPTASSGMVFASNTLATPAFSGGTGVSADAFVIPSGVSNPGSVGVQVASISVSGLIPGELVKLADLFYADNSGRFGFSNRVVDGDGVLRFSLLFNDAPASASGALYSCRIKIGENVFVSHERAVMVVVTTATPSITSPSAGSSGVALSPTISGSAYASVNGSDTHSYSDWELASDPGFTTLVAHSYLDATNKTSWPAGVTLSNNATYYARVRYAGAASGVSQWSPVTSFTTQPAVSINAPAITSPAARATAFMGNVTTSAFSVSGGSDTHLNTDWQISSDLAFSSIALQSMADAANKVSWTPSGLTGGSTYYVRARHRGAAIGVSSWSSSVAFIWVKTNQPSITSPANNATGQSANVTLSSSAFSSTGADTHASSDWQVATDSGFTNIVKRSDGDAVNKTTWTPGGLSGGVTYYARVRHTGAKSGPSAWSTSITFTTANTIGLSWTVSTPGTGVLYGTAYGLGRYVVSGYNVNGSPYFAGSISSSTNLSAWSNTNNTGSAFGREPFFDGTKFLVPIGTADNNGLGEVSVSTDGVNWTSGASAWQSVGLGACNGGFASDGVITVGAAWLANAREPVIARTTDHGATWAVTAITTSYLNNWNLELRDVIYAADVDLFVVVGGSGGRPGVWTSADGLTWTERSGSVAGSSTATSALSGVARGNGVFVAVGGYEDSPTTGVVYTSPDAINWTKRTFVGGGLRDVCWTGVLFVAVGCSSAGSKTAGGIYTSPDGVTWTPQSASGCGALLHVEMLGGKCVATGYSTSGVTSGGCVCVSQ